RDLAAARELPQLGPADLDQRARLAARQDLFGLVVRGKALQHGAQRVLTHHGPPRPFSALVRSHLGNGPERWRAIATLGPAHWTFVPSQGITQLSLYWSRA